MKVHEMAKQVGKPASDIIELLKSKGAVEKSHLSILSESDTDIIMKEYGVIESKPEILKKPVETEVHLWCPRCQQGVDYKSGPGYKSGDPCPLCLDLFKIGQIGNDAVAKLWNAEEYVADKVRRSTLIKEMRSKNKVNWIDTNNDGRIKQLEEQVAELLKQLKK